MKKLLLALWAVTAGMSAQSVKLKVEIQNPNSDSISLVSMTARKPQVFKAQKPGVFQAEVAGPAGLYQFFDGKEFTTLYLRPGFNLGMTLDAKMFDETIKYTGAGSAENNFLAKKALDDEKMQEGFGSGLPDKDALKKILDKRAADARQALSGTDLDPDFSKIMLAQISAENEQILSEIEAMAAKAAAMSKLEGNVSPGFDYENHKGGKTKLDDLRGKYVYIDVWATWCGPCRQEIPYLQAIEEKYHGKNIAFVSISADVDKDHEKWKKFVTDKNLGGIQLFADKNWESAFLQAYGIDSIPRFILIDPKGVVVSADAARPSDPALAAQLDKLLK